MTDNTQHLSNRAYAKRRGVSEKTVRKWLSEGKIEKDPVSGKIDPDRADAMLDGNLGRLPNYGHDAEKNGKRVSLAEAQTKKVNAEACSRNSRSQSSKVGSWDRAAAEEFAFKLARDALLSLPGRIGYEFSLEIECASLC